MARILAIDYGTKRVGLAVTDNLQLIASALETVATAEAIDFLKNYCTKEIVEAFVVGMPTNLDGSPTGNTAKTEGFVRVLKEQLPEIPVFLYDERFTSKMAVASMVAGGMKKKERQKKENIDKISATLILQSFMSSK